MVRASNAALPPISKRLTTVLQALLIVFLWATSWVLIKIGLVEIPPLVFAGWRYFLAFLILLAVLLLGRRTQTFAPVPRDMWLRLVVLGLLLYSVAQGAMFVALSYLPAVTVNLIMSFINLVVALLSVALLSEKPTGMQWMGIALALAGAIIYFYPAVIPQAQVMGLLAGIVCVGANAVAVIAGREVNRSLRYTPLQVTVVSMGAGSLALLGTGLIVEGMPAIGLKGWALILWLAVVNTAFTYTLWNHTLRTLTAVESSILNGTMIIWIPILAVLFLGEHMTPLEIVGLVAVGAGTLIVQLRRRPEG